MCESSSRKKGDLDLQKIEKFCENLNEPLSLVLLNLNKIFSISSQIFIAETSLKALHVLVCFDESTYVVTCSVFLFCLC